MKKLLPLIFIALLLACDSDDGTRNPFLQEVGFSFELNLDLPLYNNLNNIGNPVFVNNAGVGIRGAFVMRSTADLFVAWEASCPNHSPNECSTMVFSEGQNVTCRCEDFEYNLFTGGLLNRPNDGSGPHDMLFYNARGRGNSVIISN